MSWANTEGMHMLYLHTVGKNVIVWGSSQSALSLVACYHDEIEELSCVISDMYSLQFRRLIGE